jgi:Holliday junction resolvase RusA-like endonuclease
MACAEIAQCWKGPTIAKVKQMTLHFYIDTNSRLDVDNCVTSCLDMLQKADVIIGDHWQVLPRYSVDSFESEMGRTELTIWEA